MPKKNCQRTQRRGSVVDKEGMNPKPTSIDPDLLEGEQAFRGLRPQLEALVPPFKPRVVHIPHCVSVLLGAQPTIERMLPLMERYTPLANAGRISCMRDYGLAMAFVYHRSLPRHPVDPPEYRALVEDAYSLRRRLLSSAAHLAELGLLDEHRIAEIRAGRGHVGVGDALLALATLFEEHWPTLKDSTPIARHELHLASAHGAKLLAVATERRDRNRKGAKPDDFSRRMVHLACEVYEEARRVAAYISWYEPDLRPLPSLVRRLSRARLVAIEAGATGLSEAAEGESELRSHLAAAE
jgi:hypothetical protein